MTYLCSVNAYKITDPDFSYSITDTQLDKEIQSKDLIFNFLNDFKYDINFGDKKIKQILFH